MAEAVICRLPTTKFEFHSWPVRVCFVMENVSLGQILVTVLVVAWKYQHIDLLPKGYGPEIYHNHHHVPETLACFLILQPQDEVGPSISSSVVLCSFVLLVYIVV